MSFISIPESKKSRTRTIRCDTKVISQFPKKIIEISINYRFSRDMDYFHFQKIVAYMHTNEAKGKEMQVNIIHRIGDIDFQQFASKTYETKNGLVTNLTEIEFDGVRKVEVSIDVDNAPKVKQEVKIVPKQEKPKIEKKQQQPNIDKDVKLAIAVDIFNKAQKLSLKQLQKLQAMMELLTE